MSSPSFIDHGLSARDADGGGIFTFSIHIITIYRNESTNMKIIPKKNTHILVQELTGSSLH